MDMRNAIALVGMAVTPPGGGGGVSEVRATDSVLMHSESHNRVIYM